jgi:membrane protein required for colicin V production
VHAPRAPRTPYPPAVLVAFSLTTLDVVVLGLVLVFALRGAWKGFVWQAVRLVALFGAVWGAGAWHGWLAARLGSWFTFLPDKSVPLVSWVVIFVGLMILGSYLAHMVRGLIRSADLSGLDRMAGLVLGAATGLALCTLLLLLGGAILARTDNQDYLDDALRGSKSPVFLVRAAELLAPMLPEGVRDIWNDARKSVPAN